MRICTDSAKGIITKHSSRNKTYPTLLLYILREAKDNDKMAAVSRQTDLRYNRLCAILQIYPKTKDALIPALLTFKVTNEKNLYENAQVLAQLVHSEITTYIAKEKPILAITLTHFFNKTADALIAALANDNTFLTTEARIQYRRLAAPPPPPPAYQDPQKYYAIPGGTSVEGEEDEDEDEPASKEDQLRALLNGTPYSIETLISELGAFVPLFTITTGDSARRLVDLIFSVVDTHEITLEKTDEKWMIDTHNEIIEILAEGDANLIEIAKRLSEARITVAFSDVSMGNASGSAPPNSPPGAGGGSRSTAT